ncbi:unnamed protein product [Cunninghamella echinulata]
MSTTSTSPAIDTLIDSACKDLANQYQVDHLAKDSIKQVEEYHSQCLNKINDTNTQLTQTQSETQSIRDKLLELEQQFAF